MAAIQLRGVGKRYPDGTEAVHELDLEIADGELMVLVGPSGSGKSTALRMIAGLEEVTSGELYIGGDEVSDAPARDRDIAMIFQNYALYPHMSVRDNMGFGLKMARLPKTEIARRVDEAADLLGLTEQLDRRPARLSGGQRQRVAMGRAIVREPKAFLMDEPLSNLDAKLRVQVRAEIARLQRRLETTTVYVTHDQTEAMTLGHRVAVMRDGRLEQVGTAQDLYDHPANRFVAGFIGSPAMNFVAARLERGTLHLPFGSVALPHEVRARLRDGASGDVVAGVRPEHFADAGGPVPAGALTFATRIDLVESLGSEVHAHFETVDGVELCARIALPTPVRGGENAALLLDATRISLFDADTEESLLAPGAPAAAPLVGAPS
jgi:multiple sugar transport system ATP-binding protein